MLGRMEVSRHFPFDRRKTTLLNDYFKKRKHIGWLNDKLFAYSLDVCDDLQGFFEIAFVPVPLLSVGVVAGVVLLGGAIPTRGTNLLFKFFPGMKLKILFPILL